MFGPAEIGAVEHPALIADRADARILFKYFNDFARLIDFVLRRGEGYYPVQPKLPQKAPSAVTPTVAQSRRWAL